MTNKILKVLMTFAVASVFLVSVSVSGNEYRCSVKNVYFLQDDGSLEPSKNGYMEGENFSIDRVTGKANGAVKNHNVLLGRPCADGSGFTKCNEPYVIDHGNSEQYFKAVTIYGSHNPSVDYLVVKEFAAGEQKPFVYSDNGVITAGVCSRQGS